MKLGYDIEESERTFEKSGDVKRYTTENMKFPCFIICSDDEHPVEIFKIKLLQQMSSSSMAYNDERAESCINIYFSDGQRAATITKLFSNQVKSFLQMFENCKIEGYYTDGTKLEGDMVYVLAE